MQICLGGESPSAVHDFSVVQIGHGNGSCALIYVDFKVGGAIVRLMVSNSALNLRSTRVLRNCFAGFGVLLLLALATCSSESEPCKQGLLRLSMRCDKGVDADQIDFVWATGDKTHKVSTTGFTCGEKAVVYEFALIDGDIPAGGNLELRATPIKSGKAIGKPLVLTAAVGGCALADVHLDRSLVDGFVQSESKGDEPRTCKTDERVVAKACVLCSAGTSNAAGDDASGPDTVCDRLSCKQNQRVLGKSCVSCPSGTNNAAGDDASLEDTSCDPVVCVKNERVQAHACVSCPAGTTNGAGDDASGADTSCDLTLCAANERVQAHVCVGCAAGTSNIAGDDASVADTSCDGTLCPSNQHVVANACVACPAGTTNAAGDNGSGANTSCDAVLCKINEHVLTKACVSCPSGSMNTAGDDSSLANTACDPQLCAVDQRVDAHACVACPAGTINVAGNDAAGADTTCKAVLCKKDEHVQDRRCMPCVLGSTNDAGDDASGADTSCDSDACARALGISCAAFNESYLKPSNSDSGDNFGDSVALSGDTLVVGSTYESSNARGIDGNQTSNTGPQANNAAVDSGAVYVFVRTGNVWTQQAYIKSSNSEAEDEFGGSVSLSGDTLVVGASLEDSNAKVVDGDQQDNTASKSGAAYVFVRNGTTWSQQAYLKGPEQAASDTFGSSVVVSGDTIAVGAPNTDASAALANTGLVYVFSRRGTTWRHQASLRSNHPGVNDLFGSSLAMSGDTLAVGAVFEDSNAKTINGDETNDDAKDSGAVYVFVRKGVDWAQQAYLKASKAESGDYFGASLAISEETLAVGASGAALNSGAVVVFARAGVTWSEQVYLKASNPGPGDIFGASVALSGDTLVAGARREDGNALGVNGVETNDDAKDSGAAYVFRRTGAIWSQKAYLKASNTEAGDAFGTSVALSGNTLAVGAIREAGEARVVNGDQTTNGRPESGAVYVRRIAP